MHVDDSELQFLENITDAAIAWTKLVDRQEKQGPVTQVRLIQEALSISYLDDVSAWPETTDYLRDICNCIYVHAQHPQKES
jgi:hypothetical protein